MIKPVITCFICLFFASAFSYGQPTDLTLADSINTFYDAFFVELEKHFIHSDNVDWETLKPIIKKQAQKHSTFETSLQTSSALFDSIGGDHMLLLSDTGWYFGTKKKQPVADDFHPSFVKKLETGTGPTFEAKMIADDYGYLLIPWMVLINHTQEQVDSNTQMIYDSIAHITERYHPKGWIVDLRFNTGGNAYSQLDGMYHFLGDNTTYLSRNAKQDITNIHRVEAGKFYDGCDIKATIEVSLTPDLEIPIAFITGPLTASAGEFIIFGFRGRDNMIVIGEETFGLTTGNNLFELPYNTKTALTSAYATDRKGKHSPTIIPDISIIKQANYEDLTQDQNVIEAMKFIDSVNQKMKD